jgi:hypothetical protein
MSPSVEQHSHWHPGRKNAPYYLEQCRHLTQARAEHPWLAAGSHTRFHTYRAWAQWSRSTASCAGVGSSRYRDIRTH